MKKHYYEFDSITGNCKIECNVWKNEPNGLRGVKIGSAACKQKCPFCKGFDEEENWIKCSRLDEALNDQ